MTALISQTDLKNTLLEFRYILKDFDFSSIDNIRFFNLESFFSYVENVKNNPFKKQLNLLNQKLDILQPYLPFVTSDRATEFLTAISRCDTEETSTKVKRKFMKKIRQDFIDLTRTLSTQEQWEQVLEACEEVRLHKEECALAIN